MTAETMKRSTATELFVTPKDFNLALNGVKTATSRLGDRRELWPVGSKIRLVDNKRGLHWKIEITYNILMTLDQISISQAGNIGGYNVTEHLMDFTSIYPGSSCKTELSLVGFRLL